MSASVFPPGTINHRPRVALSLFTMLLGDVMRNIRVDKAPKTIASPRQNTGASSGSQQSSSSQSQQQQSNNNSGDGSASGGGGPETYSLLAESNEAAFKSMGVDVGMKSVAHIADIALQNQNEPKVRPASFLDAAKFVATHCWEYWFDHAPFQKFQHLEAYYIDEYESLSCFPFAGPGRDAAGAVNGIQFSTFVQGMVEGAMRACGWPVLVNFSQADEQGLQQYQILPLSLPALPTNV